MILEKFAINIFIFKMPPKKDEVDLNALPPLKHLCVGIRIEAGKARTAKL